MKNRPIQGVYILEFIDGIKIGISKDCVARIKQYYSPWVKPIIRGEYIGCQFPALVENTIKQWFKSNINSKYSNEFITGIKYNDVKEVINRFKFKTPQYVKINRHFKDCQWVNIKI